QDALAATGGLGNQQEEDVGVALELERTPPRHVRDQLETVAEIERRCEVAVGRPEVADEAGRDVVEPGAGKGAEERARITLAEEGSRVRDPEALGRRVRQP